MRHQSERQLNPFGRSDCNFKANNTKRLSKRAAKPLKKSLMAAASLVGAGMGAGLSSANARETTFSLGDISYEDNASYQSAFTGMSSPNYAAKQPSLKTAHETHHQGSVPFVASHHLGAPHPVSGALAQNDQTQTPWPHHQEHEDSLLALRPWHLGAFLAGGFAALVRIFGANRILNFVAAAAPSATRAAKAVADAPVKAARAVAKSAAGWGRFVLAIGVIGVFALAGVGYYDVEWLGGLAAGGALAALMGHGGAMMRRGLSLSPIRIRGRMWGHMRGDERT